MEVITLLLQVEVALGPSCLSKWNTMRSKWPFEKLLTAPWQKSIWRGIACLDYKIQ